MDNETLSVEAGGRGSSRHLDVSELVYLGVEESRRTKLRLQGLIDFSFRVSLVWFYYPGEAILQCHQKKASRSQLAIHPLVSSIQGGSDREYFFVSGLH